MLKSQPGCNLTVGERTRHGQGMKASLEILGGWVVMDKMFQREESLLQMLSAVGEDSRRRLPENVGPNLQGSNLSGVVGLEQEKTLRGRVFKVEERH